MNANCLALILSVLTTPQGEVTNGQKTPSEILSNMFAHYAAAKSAVGTVTMTQTANAVSIHTKTELQFDRPSQLYIRQVRDGSRSHQWLVTSNGKDWSYDRPDTQSGGYGKSRYHEYVTQHGYTMNLADFLGASSKSLGDVNPMLISAISSKEWMKQLTGQWASLDNRGKTTLGDLSVVEITGQYRENPSMPASGTFEIYVTDAGDFVRYVVHQRLAFPKISQEPVDVTTIWDSTIKINVQTDPNLYRVVLSN